MDTSSLEDQCLLKAYSALVNNQDGVFSELGIDPRVPCPIPDTGFKVQDGSMYVYVTCRDPLGFPCQEQICPLSDAQVVQRVEHALQRELSRMSVKHTIH